MGLLRWDESLVITLPLAVMFAFICLSPLYLVRSFSLERTSFLKLGLLFLSAAFCSAAIWTAIGKLMAMMLISVLPRLSDRFDDAVPVLVAVGMLLYLLSVSGHYLLEAFDTARTTERKALELQVLARDSALRALKMQLHPHFLFNSLNSISALTTANPHGARAMTLQLAAFLRETLKLESLGTIPLADELRLMTTFLSIEQVRFGARLQFSIRTEPAATAWPVPPLILQPLVENAVNHGIAGLIEGGTIAIDAHSNGRTLTVRIENPVDVEAGRGPTHGVGLQNVSGRLRTMYGDDAWMNIQRPEGKFCVEIRLPSPDPARNTANAA